MEPSTVSASCLCGEVRSEIALPLRVPEGIGAASLLTMFHCHCSRCRKAHGAVYATYLVVPENQFQLVHGAESIAGYRSSPGMRRTFCRHCGSVVSDGTAWEGQVGVPAGLLNGDPGLRPMAHIFVGSKAPWITLSDGLPAFETLPPGIDAPKLPTRGPVDPETGETRGSCLCGAVTYVLTAAPIRCVICHCSRCRKAYSAVHAENLIVPLDGVRFTKGEDFVETYKVPEARFFLHSFCRICGSSVPRRSPGRGITIVPMGSLDDDPGIRPTMHIFVGSRAPWETMTDALPQHDGYPTELR